MVLTTHLWQTQPWFSHVLEMYVENLFLLPNIPKFLVHPKENHYQLVVNNFFLSTTSLESLTESLALHGVPKEATELITCVRRKETVSNYESNWRKGVGFSCCYTCVFPPYSLSLLTVWYSAGSNMLHDWPQLLNIRLYFNFIYKIRITLWVLSTLM